MQTRPGMQRGSRARLRVGETAPLRGASARVSRNFEWVRLPEPFHPVACTYSTRAAEHLSAACDDRSRVRASHRLTVPSSAPALPRRLELLQGPGAQALRSDVGRLAGPTEPAFGAAASMASNPPTLRSVHASRPSGRRRGVHAMLGSRSVIGSGVGVVAEKNGQATVATETSRPAHLRVLRRELPI